MTSDNSARIGFIGTGIMGGHMARRLAETGFAVTAWNRSLGKAEALTRFRVGTAAAAAEAVRHAKIVICMLSSGPVCDEVLFGPDAVAETKSPGSTLVVTSSIPVETARKQGVQAQGRRSDMWMHRSRAAKGVRGTLAIMGGGASGRRCGILPRRAGAPLPSRS